jgi:hypothetical protein
MKKIIKIINIFLFTLVFFSFSLNFVSAVVVVWSYTDSTSNYTSALFQTADECNASLTQYRVNHPIISLNCVSSFTAAVGIWSYKESTDPSANTSASFQTIAECNANRAQYMIAHIGVNPTTCIISSDIPVSVTGIATTNTGNTYTLLAPIGGMTTAPTNIGDYFNKIFLIAIGLCGALAVIMIVIGGVQYMGDESIFGKTEAKSHIKNAILGLLIALASYVLLNTINPDLLGKGGVNIQQVSAEITPLYDRGATDPKQPNGESVRCVPLASGPCSVANLATTLGVDTITATAMSKICNMESSGTPATSGTDICKPGNTAFSFGLFQINLSANGSLAGPDCVGIFDRAVSSSDAIVPKYTSGFTCSLLPSKETLYNTCKNRLLDTATNLAIAKSLLAASPNKSPWIGDKKYCASAFN